MANITFLNLSSTLPANKQDVWLLRHEAAVAVPARYLAATDHYREYFSLLEEASSFDMDGAWAAMEHPENANAFDQSSENE